MEPIVVVRNLGHVYRTGPARRAALVDVSLEVQRGSCVAIVGVNGSGKSTLVQHFNGLLRPTSGDVVVEGVSVATARGTEIAKLRRRVGMLFQSPEAQLFERTVYADVAFGPRQLGLSMREVHSKVFAALERVGLPPREYARRSPFELSGGQMRRVALAGVLAASPSILVADEPTVGLDAGGRNEFYSYLRRIKEEGATIVLVSHDMAEVASIADQVFVLHAGRLVMQGTPRAVFADPDQLRRYRLAAPPLAELLDSLRRCGLPVPEDLHTIDEAFRWLTTRMRAPGVEAAMLPAHLSPGDPGQSPGGDNRAR